MSYLYLAFHYPKPEHRNDLLVAMHKLDLAMHGTPGLLHIGAWSEESGSRIIAISIWDSPSSFQAALLKIGTAVAGVPFNEWEARPRELIRAEGINFP
jgi:precorrin-6B methylase 1